MLEILTHSEIYKKGSLLCIVHLIKFFGIWEIYHQGWSLYILTFWKRLANRYVQQDRNVYLSISNGKYIEAYYVFLDRITFGQNFVEQNFRHQADILTLLSDFCLTFVSKYWTKFSTDKIFDIKPKCRQLWLGNFCQIR